LLCGNILCSTNSHSNDVRLVVIRICYVVTFKVLYCAVSIATEDKTSATTHNFSIAVCKMKKSPGELNLPFHKFLL